MHGIFPYIQDKKHLIWDWNGTLLDDARLCVEVLGELLVEHHLPAVTLEQYRSHFRLPVRKYYEHLGFRFDIFSFDEIAGEWIKRYMQRVSDQRLFPKTIDFLKLCMGSARAQHILSAAKETDLHHLLRHFGISHFFQYVFGLDDNSASSKLERGRALLQQLGCQPEEAILIGDTDHDIFVGRELGIQVLALGDGHQSPERLVGLGVPILVR